MLLTRTITFPVYGQIAVQSYGTENLVEVDDEFWNTGITAGSHMLLIRAVDSLESHVIVDIRSDDSSGKLIYDGVMRFDSDSLSVGPPTADNGPTMYLPRTGEWHVRVFAEPEGEPHHLTVVLPEYNDPKTPDVP